MLLAVDGVSFALNEVLLLVNSRQVGRDAIATNVEQVRLILVKVRIIEESNDVLTDIVWHLLSLIHAICLLLCAIVQAVGRGAAVQSP